MNIKIYAIGKIKENYLKEGICEYIKRITPYCKIEIIELSDEPIKDKPNISEIEKVKSLEGEKVLKLIKSNDYLVGLDLNNNQFTSEEFACFIDKCLEKGGSKFSFVIGGSYGLSKELKNRCNCFVCLSKMTFLHQMSRLILLEQIYRAFKINNNEVYHK